jgi:hypothetical protein
MFGEPAAVAGECNACLFIGDNYGDGTATMRCQLAPGHDGVHREVFEREGGPVTITWVADERKKCDHGCGQWRHDHRDESISCPNDADDHAFSDCAYCHPNSTALTCSACDKTYYYEEGHKWHCAGAFACTDCGENGFGVHVCPKRSDGSFDDPFNHVPGENDSIQGDSHDLSDTTTVTQEQMMTEAAFNAVHRRLATEGACDSTGGMEYERVKREWLVAGRPEIEPFIRARSNVGPNG